MATNDSPQEALEGKVPDLFHRVVPLETWWDTQKMNVSNTSATPVPSTCQSLNLIPLLDLRPMQEFKKQRLFHSKLNVVPFPIPFLKERSFELPARHVQFSILVHPTDLEMASTFLLGIKPNARKRPRQPWKINHVLLDDSNLWQHAQSLGILSTTYQLPFPQPRLWQPDPMVETVLLPLLKEQYTTKFASLGTDTNSTATRSNDAEVQWQVWDLASGSGRDVAFLAEELLHAQTPYDVLGFDHRYNDKETTITQGFWDRRGVGDYTRCIQMDLSDWNNLVSNRDTYHDIHKVAALFAVRFWKPELVTAIATGGNDQQRPPPGTLFGLSHFCKPYPGAPWDFAHPSEKTVLERNQLHDLFQNNGWDILHDEIVLDSDHGRTMINFVAKKQ